MRVCVACVCACVCVRECVCMLRCACICVCYGSEHIEHFAQLIGTDNYPNFNIVDNVPVNSKPGIREIGIIIKIDAGVIYHKLMVFSCLTDY